jgi:hypothetical protein
MEEILINDIATAKAKATATTLKIRIKNCWELLLYTRWRIETKFAT